MIRHITHEWWHLRNGKEIPLRRRLYHFGHEMVWTFVWRPYYEVIEAISPSKSARARRAEIRYAGVHPNRIPWRARKASPYLAAKANAWEDCYR